jgi:hypothetical protein
MLHELNPEARALANYMSSLSEQAYSAQWMSGLEHALWFALCDGPFRYGRLQLTRDHVAALGRLSDTCDGWIVSDPVREERFVPVREWIADHYDRALVSRGP